MGLITAALKAMPDWFLGLAYALGSAARPALRARSPLSMCATSGSRHPVLPAGYTLQEVRDATPPAGWTETLASAGIHVTADTWAADFARDTKARVVSIFHDGVMVATAGVTPLESGEPAAGLLTWVGVRKEHQGRGLARPLIEACLREASEAGMTTIVLLTDDHRLPAIRTYLTTGFRPCINSWDWTHRPRWRAIARLLGKDIRDCGDRAHARVLALIRF